MASFVPVGKKWRAHIRRAGQKAITKTFPDKTLAIKWATATEAAMDAGKYQDKRSLKQMTFGELIKRYREEIGGTKGFGKNKEAVLRSLEEKLGHVAMSNLDDDRLIEFIKDRRAEGAGGVTISIDLTYMTGVFKVARHLWKIPVSLDAVTIARANMKHLRISTKSKERTRRPTMVELDQLCTYFDEHSALPMRDLIWFAVYSAMRLGEITRLKWEDLDQTNRTIIIRDRKHPNQKEGNDQEVPLLGPAFDIVLRQPRTSALIFPYKAATISCIFPRACQALGIEDLHFHDLRHEGVSRLFERGFKIEQVSMVSGHRDWKMLKRYTQLKAADLHRFF